MTRAPWAARSGPRPNRLGLMAAVVPLLATLALVPLSQSADAAPSSPSRAASATPPQAASTTAAATGPVVDQQVATHQATRSSSISSPPLTTSQAGELILAFVMSEGSGTAAQSVTSVTGGGLSWRLRQRSNTQRGTSEIWQAVAPTVATDLVVRARRAGASSGCSIVVVAFIGASTTTDGATTSGSAATGSPGATLIPTRGGSWVWGVGNDTDRAAARTVGAGQSMADQYLAPAGDTFWVQRQNVPSAGGTPTPVTINDTAPTTDRWNLALIEIPPAIATTPGPGTTPGFNPGNPTGSAPVPSGMGQEDVSQPDHVIGDGTPGSCTSAAVLSAVTAGGVITFSCGPNPVTITLTQTAKVRNSTRRLVIDGGGTVTLSGGGANRILYVDTCDTSLGTVSGNCLYAPSWPQVTVQNLTFADGNATNATYVSPGDTNQGSNGGGAIFQLGGRLKVVRSAFVRNTCAANGPDLGGAAVRVLAQHSATPNDLDASYAARNQDPVAIVQSTFGGASGQGNSCSNGGAISGLRTPITVLNSLIKDNHAVGCCSNPPKSGTPGGGSGGAIYTDGTSYDLTIAGTDIENNTAKAGGSAIFYVSNDRTGHLVIDGSTLRNNTYAPSGQPTDQHFENYPGIFYLGNGAPIFTNSTIQ